MSKDAQTYRKVEETFRIKADNADKHPRDDWNGDSFRETAEKAARKAEELEKKK